MLEKYVAVIQAGGKGTRMESLTKGEIPKPLLEINGKTMIEWQIENAGKYGIQEFVLIVGHLGEKIKEYFQDGAKLGIHLTYIEEKEPLGSAGSLYYLKNKLHNDNFILIFGDVMFDMDLERMVHFHERHNAFATLAVHPNTHPYDSDLVMMNDEGQVTGFDAKTNDRTYWYRNLVNAGIYVLSDRLIAGIAEPQKLDLEKDLIFPAITSGKVYGYQTTEYIRDAGTPDRFHEVGMEQKNGLWEMKNLKKKQKCIFIDGDGTLNVYKGLIADIDAFELEKGAAEAVGLINRSGYLVIVATNQPVVSRGVCEISDVEHIHRKMEVLLGRQGAYVDDTGMIMQMAAKHNIDLSESYMIGDSTVDIQTGINAGLKTVLVKTGQAGTDRKYDVKADFEADNIQEAVKLILEKEGI
ncbi:MAG: HAD-IIIA family hydrolase [Acetatifactor sp.]|nr:HAD-IIIA family hydrolase [Acetatifactor sp.]